MGIPSHLLFVSAKGSDGKREYRATGTIMRFFEQPVTAISAGVWGVVTSSAWPK